MSYSDLLAQQDKELERLNQEYYTDQATIRQLQNDHYDKTKYDGQLDRLKTLHEKKVKDVQTRFSQEQREYLGEPTPPEPLPDISQSQDKAADMIKAYRQQQTSAQASAQQNLGGSQEIKRPQHAKGQVVDEAEVKKLAQQAREKREQKQQQHRRGFRR
ncbi:hypothetical protein EXU85_30145 [Spirosoma sp. KCTC 42546]|uniref:hypothetical protein n=1 Tax=Spirosoma sp. KCTC 42546 TaxID=2520506 RepID=UPI00115BDFE4|nr:hypothetical protein [Spirosoma sp. KCTC 42546]QDK82641.1 hypothetical protein EXU85_30145 [Spirosoma sp. KCTC 42546]